MREKPFYVWRNDFRGCWEVYRACDNKKDVCEETGLFARQSAQELCNELNESE